MFKRFLGSSTRTPALEEPVSNMSMEAESRRQQLDAWSAANPTQLCGHRNTFDLPPTKSEVCRKRHGSVGSGVAQAPAVPTSKRVSYRLKDDPSSDVFRLPFYYMPKKALGEGAYAQVWEILDTRTGATFAVKKNRGVFDNLTDAKRILREIKLLRHLEGHPNVMSMIDVVLPEEAKRQAFNDAYLVMPKMDTSLARVIKRSKLSVKHHQFFTYQLLCGLKHIHAAGVIHRDLKPENVLVNANDCNLRISDFGLSRGVCEEKALDMTEYVVTRWYRAPEVMCCARQYDQKVDMWSVGCILAELWLRKPLFPGANHVEQLKLIFSVLGTPAKDKVDWMTTTGARSWVRSMKNFKPKNMNKILKPAPPEAVDLISKMLRVNPAERISVDEALAHPFLSAIRQRYPHQAQSSVQRFDLSFEFEASINTKFGVRHMMYEEMRDFKQRKRANSTSVDSDAGSPMDQ